MNQKGLAKGLAVMLTAVSVRLRFAKYNRRRYGDRAREL